MASGPTIVATIGADTKPLQQEMKKAESHGREFSHALREMFAGIGFTEAIKSLYEFTTGIQRTADTLDMTVESWQRLSAAFEAHSSPEKVEKAMVKLNQSIEEARSGNADMVASFEKLGVTWEDLFRASPEEILYKIADSAKESKDPTETLASIMAVMGRNARTMVADLKQGSEEIKRVGDSAAVVSEKTTHLAETFERKIAGIARNVKAFWASVLTGEGIPEGLRPQGEAGAIPSEHTLDVARNKVIQAHVVPEGGSFGQGPLPLSPAEKEQMKKDAEEAREIGEKALKDEKEYADYQKRINEALEKQKELERQILQTVREKHSEASQQIHEAKKAAQDRAREEFIDDPSIKGEHAKRREERHRDRLSKRFDRLREHEQREDERRAQTGAVRHGLPDRFDRAQAAFEKEKDKINQKMGEDIAKILSKMDGWVKSQ